MLFFKTIILLIDKLKHTEPYKSQPHIQRLIKKLYTADPNDNFRTPLDKYLDQSVLGKMGSMCVGDFLYSCAFNETTIIRMVEHGAESKNPSIGQMGAEPFGALTHYHKGRTIHTNDEESCLHFYFFDQEYAQQQYIEVHPSWLRGPNKEKWLALIEYQALNGMSKRISESFTALRGVFPQEAKQVHKLLKDIKNRQELNLQSNKKDLIWKTNHTDSVAFFKAVEEKHGIKLEPFKSWAKIEQERAEKSKEVHEASKHSDSSWRHIK